MNRDIDFNAAPIKLELKSVNAVGPYFHRDAMEILFVINGEAEVERNGEIISVKEGEFAIIDAGMFHTVTGGSNCLLMPIFLDMKYFEARIGYIRGISFKLKINSDDKESLAHAEILRTLSIRLLVATMLGIPDGDRICVDIANTMMSLLLKRFINTTYFKLPVATLSEFELQRLYTMIAFVYEHFREPINVSTIAAQLNLSKSRVAHFFTDILKVTLHDNITLNRVFEVARLLTETDKPASRLASECGFANEKAFFREFKNIFGTTPDKFRKNVYRENYIDEEDLVITDNVDLLWEYCSKYFASRPALDFIEDEKQRKTEENILRLLGLSLKAKTRNKTSRHSEQTSGNLALALQKGLLIKEGRYEINYEYVYMALFLFRALNAHVRVFFEISLMLLDEWGRVIKELANYIEMEWRNDFGKPIEVLILALDLDELALASSFIETPVMKGFSNGVTLIRI